MKRQRDFGVWVKRVLAAILLTGIFVTTGKAELLKAGTTEWNTVETSDWMEYADGELKLGELNIPGTHDAATQYSDLSFFSKTQTEDIYGQLADGYRYLDIRLACDGDRLKLVHGFVACRTGKTVFSDRLYLEEVLNQCYTFLEEHPTETIVFCVKKDHGDETDAEFQRLLYSYIDADREEWYLENREPALEEVRGKIVLVRRYENEAGYSEQESGLDLSWNEQSGKEVMKCPYEQNQTESGLDLWVQDRYCYDTMDKWNAVKECLENSPLAGENQIFINFLSTKGTKSFGHPVKYAKVINENFVEMNLEQGERYGWIIMDYGTEELARKVFSLNEYQE